MKRTLKLTDIAREGDRQLTELDMADFVPLPPPYDKTEELPELKKPTEDQKNRMEFNLDGYSALTLPKPKNKEEEKKYIDLFISGLKKLFKKENNWAFLQPLILSLEYCAQCQTCNDSCPIYTASGKNDLYRPTYRSEIFRRLVKKYIKPGGKFWQKLNAADIELNWATISRLYELSYRCTLCRRCTQACPMGVDNGLITRELRKLFSEELGWAPRELHEQGTVLELATGATSGMKPEVLKDNISFLDEDFTEVTGIEVKSVLDKEGADVLIIHSAGDILTFPESVVAFTILCNAAGINWTLSSEVGGYDGVNYGLFYDDVQLSKIATRHAQIAKKLGVKKIVLGECGHEHKTLLAVSDRILTGELNIPRESAMTFLESIVFSGKIKFEPAKNNFPITLHDPCNIVRNVGIVEPQRRILRYLCPQFREMTPHGVDNYCCGGGGGLSLIAPTNFTDWKVNIAGRIKFKQIIEAFQDQPGPEVKKYVCAPCMNCKTQIRDIFEHFKAREKSGLYYGGLAELIVNAMADIKKPYIQWDEM